MSNLMTGTSGVYKTEYGFTTVTVKIFQSPELEGEDDQSVWQAIVTYTEDNKPPRQDFDTLTIEQRNHCRQRAVELEKENDKKPYSDLHKAYMALAYWNLIK